MLAAEVAVLAIAPFQMLAKNSRGRFARIRAARARKPACMEVLNPSSAVVEVALRATKQRFHAHPQPMDAKPTMLCPEALDLLSTVAMVILPVSGLGQLMVVSDSFMIRAMENMPAMLLEDLVVGFNPSRIVAMMIAPVY
jgi:hypothetical protein